MCDCYNGRGVPLDGVISTLRRAVLTVLWISFCHMYCV